MSANPYRQAYASFQDIFWDIIFSELLPLLTREQLPAALRILEKKCDEHPKAAREFFVILTEQQCAQAIEILGRKIAAVRGEYRGPNSYGEFEALECLWIAARNRLPFDPLK